MHTLGSTIIWCFSWYYVIHSTMDNGSHSRCNMGLLMIETVITGSKLWLMHFYQDQLNKFTKLGLGKFTEFDVKVTEELIATTQKRLDEITIVYDRKLIPMRVSFRRAHSLRRSLQRHMDKEKLLNESTNSNGATEAQISKDICNNGHDGGES